ncbi:P-glycoprotein 20, partial [Striga asiatica]
MMKSGKGMVKLKEEVLYRISNPQAKHCVVGQESQNSELLLPEELIENVLTAIEPTIKRRDSFEMRLPELPKIDVHPTHLQTNASYPESHISPLLTSDPKNESFLIHKHLAYSADNLSCRTVNDATFVRAAFSNQLSMLQDSAAVVVVRLAFVALSTLPTLMVTAAVQRKLPCRVAGCLRHRAQ